MSAVHSIATGDGGPIAVLLCADLRTAGRGIDLSEVMVRLTSDGELNVRVRVVEDLCRRPDAVADAGAGGGARVVLGLCSGRVAESELYHRARKAGLDPFGIELLDLGALCAASQPETCRIEKAAAVLAAAVAKVAAFGGTGPESVKPRLLREGQVVSRRGLFTLPPVRYEPVAVIARRRCASEMGCDLCVRACPRDALAIDNGRIAVDKAACDACGVCVSACPRGAVDLAGASLPQIEAQLGEMLRAAPFSAPKAILFACRSSLASLEASGEVERLYSAGWLPLRVPCAGMVRPGWLVQSLANGAASVGLLSCRDACAFGQSAAVQARVEFCEQLLEALGRPPHSVRLFGPSELAAAPATARDDAPAARDHRAPTLREPKATALAILQLHAGGVGHAMAAGVTHPAGPLGTVAVDPAGCTMCEACAHACPTDALTSWGDGERVTLEFDPTACNACALCERSCPESVITVRRVADLDTLALGRTPLHLDVVARCEGCDAQIAPDGMMRRVRQLLGDGSSASTVTALRRCPSCRGMGMTLPALGDDAGPAGASRTGPP